MSLHNLLLSFIESYAWQDCRYSQIQFTLVLICCCPVLFFPSERSGQREEAGARQDRPRNLTAATAL
ncbi:hypothetical protein DTO212C5_5052 [Paecilomyces variotii]|nr:hypothetical protein DTO212C5_5052 [Paecilomyces variotii]